MKIVIDDLNEFIEKLNIYQSMLYAVYGEDNMCVSDVVTLLEQYEVKEG